MVEQGQKKANPQDKRVLLFDDDDSIRTMLQRTLEAEGFQVKTGRDGRNILPKALEFKPDLILTDLMMPGGSGYEVLRILQSDESTRSIPVFIMTGYTLDVSTKQLLQQEPNVKYFLEKPIRPDDMLSRIHKTLGTLSREEKMVQDSQQNLPDRENLEGFF